jgi:hypothetical protein
MTKISYAGYRFPPEVIHQAIWLYLRFTLSFRDVEDLLAERGIVVSYETVRRWVNHFGPMIAAHLRKHRPKPHATWRLDEVYLKSMGEWFSRFSNQRRPARGLGRREPGIRCFRGGAQRARLDETSRRSGPAGAFGHVHPRPRLSELADRRQTVC